MELNEELDWDLHAIVRAFTSSSSSTTTTTSVAAADHVPRRHCFSSVDSCSVSKSEEKGEREDFVSRFEYPFGRIGESSAGLEDLCKPFCSDFDSLDPSSRTTCSVSGVSLRGLMAINPKPERFSPQNSIIAANPTGKGRHRNHKVKKRKNVMKKVCYVPAEELSDDVWAWRKYGQKPIKGSPYPRGYYRCSSSKGCSARKQVERNRSDPKMFIVTYRAEHNHPAPTHRNSLAGSARHKTNTSQSQKSASNTLADSGSPISTTAPQVQYSCSSPTTSRSPTTESKTDYGDFIKDDYDSKTEASRMILDDDHPFLGFEDLDRLDIVGDCFLDQFPATVEFPWLVNNNSSSSTAAGGG